MNKKQEKAIDNLVNILDKAYGLNRQLFMRSFFSGIFSALGATIGFSIILIILGLILKQISAIPFIGQYISSIYHNIAHNTHI